MLEAPEATGLSPEGNHHEHQHHREPPPNGVDIATLFATLDAVKDQPEIAKFQFRATQHVARRDPQPVASISGFHGAMQEMEHKHVTVVEADHPAVLVGRDHAPTPVEYLLHAIAACLTSGIANIAAARGVTLTRVSSTVEGDIDLLGILGLSDGTVRNGYQQIRVTFHIEGDADDETLREIVEQSRRRSAVYDALTKPTPVARSTWSPADRRRATSRPGPAATPGPGRPGPEGHPMSTIDTVVIGAGHAGLAVSRLLADAGREHVVLDRGRVAERWRTERWDSLHLLTPRWMTRLPAGGTPARDPDGFMSAGAARRPPRAVRRSFDAPVVSGATVRRLPPDRPGLRVAHGRRHLAGPPRRDRHRTARQAARPCGGRAPRHRVITGADYRNPTGCGRRRPGRRCLPSGVQIADELARSGRDVVLAVGRHTRMPRRYRGMDVYWWLEATGRLARTIDRCRTRPRPAESRPSSWSAAPARTPWRAPWTWRRCNVVACG